MRNGARRNRNLHAAMAFVIAGFAALSVLAEPPTGTLWRFTYNGEVFADVRGGIRTGAVYTGLLQGAVDWHWQGWTAHGDGYLPHGDSLTLRDAGAFSNPSNIDAPHQLRLHELWGQCRIGEFSVRIGLLAGDSEFWGSDTANLFINSAFGAPTVVSGNLPNSPIFPQGVPGLRAASDLDPHDTLRVVVLDGDGGDPTGFNRHGLRFAFNHGALLVVEDQHLFGNPAAPTASARFGAFFHTGDFTDSHGAGVHGNWGALGVVDYTINEKLVWFARAGIAERDRSPAPWSVETGFDRNGALGARNTFGVALGYIDFNDRLAINGNPPGLRHEIILESTLNVPVSDQLTLQPDLQYVVDPGGVPTARNALLVGLRASLTLGR